MTMMNFFWLPVLIALTAPVSAIAQETGATGLTLAAEQQGLRIEGPFVRATPGAARVAGGYMLLVNTTDTDDRLLAADSPVSEVTELHTHIDDGGIMRMREVKAIDIPAGGRTALEPGGLHLMFIDLVKPLVEGETVHVTLLFEHAGEVHLQMPVLGFGATRASIVDDHAATPGG